MENLKILVQKYIRKKNIIIALGCIIIFLGMFFAFRPNQTYIQAENQLNALMNNIRQFYRNKPNAWGLNSYSAIQNKIVPQEMINGRQIQNALKKEVLLGANEFGNTIMPGNNKIAIVYKNLDKNECVALSGAKFSENMKLSINMIKIINEKQHIYTWGGDYQLPISKENALKSCTENNDILWEIYL